MSVTAPVSHAEMWPCAASALVGLPHHSAIAPCRLLLELNIPAPGRSGSGGGDGGGDGGDGGGGGGGGSGHRVEQARQ